MCERVRCVWVYEWLCVGVCVWEREREREREWVVIRSKQWHVAKVLTSPWSQKAQTISENSIWDESTVVVAVVCGILNFKFCLLSTFSSSTKIFKFCGNLLLIRSANFYLFFYFKLLCFFSNCFFVFNVMHLSLKQFPTYCHQLALYNFLVKLLRLI